MNREVHVRICEGLGVKFPGPTRQLPTPKPRSTDCRFHYPSSNSDLKVEERKPLLFRCWACHFTAPHLVSASRGKADVSDPRRTSGSKDRQKPTRHGTRRIEWILKYVSVVASGGSLVCCAC